jgi:hypothetical protein
MARTRDSWGQTRRSEAGSPQGIDKIQFSSVGRTLDRQRLNSRRSHFEILPSKASHRPTRWCNRSVIKIERFNGRRDVSVSILGGCRQKFHGV